EASAADLGESAQPRTPLGCGGQRSPVRGAVVVLGRRDEPRAALARRGRRGRRGGVRRRQGGARSRGRADRGGPTGAGRAAQGPVGRERIARRPAIRTLGWKFGLAGAVAVVSMLGAMVLMVGEPDGGGSLKQVDLLGPALMPLAHRLRDALGGTTGLDPRWIK